MFLIQKTGDFTFDLREVSGKPNLRDLTQNSTNSPPAPANRQESTYSQIYDVITSNKMYSVIPNKLPLSSNAETEEQE